MCQIIPVRVHPDIDAVLASLEDEPELAILDSVDAAPSRGRYTIFACEPLDVVSCRPSDPDPFETMRSKCQLTCPADARRSAGGTTDASYSGFIGGWIGFYAYEAGRYIEVLPENRSCDVPLPLARFSLFDLAAVYDGHEQAWFLVAAPDLEKKISHSGIAPLADRIEQWQQRMKLACNQPRSAICKPPQLTPVHNMPPADYMHMVARGKEYIAAGDIFQVNLARRESVPATESTMAIYRRLRQSNPSEYAALLRWHEASTGSDSEQAVLSASPELFLTLTGRNVTTRPIKGTCPRSTDPTVDRTNQQALATSEKDRAELAMIVDLERNDLGRVCDFGSIRVVSGPESTAFPFHLEHHPTVHHLVADVVGQLREGHDAIDLLRACFPGGSITGAPKVRAMEIIAELEPSQRSVYTGSIGYFSCNGNMAFNIAIRTIIRAAGQLHTYSGGGIVADSSPEAEYNETVYKIAGLRRALTRVTADCYNTSQPTQVRA